jgi:hypothetical protein
MCSVVVRVDVPVSGVCVGVWYCCVCVCLPLVRACLPGHNYYVRLPRNNN